MLAFAEKVWNAVLFQGKSLEDDKSRFPKL